MLERERWGKGMVGKFVKTRKRIRGEGKDGKREGIELR